MRNYSGSFIRLLLSIFAVALILAISAASAQTISGQTAQDGIAKMAGSESSSSAGSKLPVFTNYRGVKIGMSAKEVRATIEGLKKSDVQDLLVFSDKESAQIYYDDAGKVIAISVDYFSGSSAPAPNAVLGMELEPKPDGSMYQLKRYPDAGFWVCYNRTAGDKPIVTITLQKL